jgi:hypothetical protein
MDQEKLLCWNVRGLNSRARRSVVRNIVLSERMSLLCLQETKVHNDSLVILVAWCTWKERNLRVFQGQARSPATLVVAIAEEADRWSLAGFSQLAALWAGMTA